MATVRAGRSIPSVRRIAAPENLGILLASLILCMTPGSGPAAGGRAASDAAVRPAQASSEGLTAGWIAHGAQGGANFGISVETAGDVNGDGFADVVVGAYLYDHGQTNEGRVFVYHGSPTGPQATAAWTAESDEPLSSFGFSAA